VAVSSRTDFSLEVGLEISSVVNTGTCSQKIDDSCRRSVFVSDDG